MRLRQHFFGRALKCRSNVKHRKTILAENEDSHACDISLHIGHLLACIRVKFTLRAPS